MNRITVVILALLSTLVFADQERFQKVTGYHFNDIWKKMSAFQLDLRYDREEDKVYIYIPEFITTVAFELDAGDRQQFILMIDKYVEWRHKAIEMEVELEKDIADIKLKGYYELGDEWHHTCKKSSLIRSSFFSQNKTRHQLVLSFGKIIDCYNQYSDHKPASVYLEYDDILILREALTSERLIAVEIEIDKKKALEDTFK